MDKFRLGWSQDRAPGVSVEADSCIVRIIKRYRQFYRALSFTGGQINCYLKGRMIDDLPLEQLPVIGDWCTLTDGFLDQGNNHSANINSVLPRSSQLVRLAAGEEYQEQVLAANVDFAFILSSINRDFNLNRLSRFIVLCKSGGVVPVIVLSKIDLVDDKRFCEIEFELQEAFPSIDYLSTSAYRQEGISTLKSYMKPGTTSVFLGSSGVGKSTLVNQLLNSNIAKTGDIRKVDSRGRHTTTGSEMFFLPEGGIIIDTPGLREVGMVGSSLAEEAITGSVNQYASLCKFRNCSHTQEPGCRVQAAVSDSEISAVEFANYKQLEREVAYSKRKLDQKLANEERKRWKKIAVANRKNKKRN